MFLELSNPAFVDLVLLGMKKLINVMLFFFNCYCLFLEILLIENNNNVEIDGMEDTCGAFNGKICFIVAISWMDIFYFGKYFHLTTKPTNLLSNLL